MRLHLLRATALLVLAVAGAACGSNSGSGGSAFTSYLEAKEPRVTCPAPTLVNGGLNPAIDPGPVCLGPPRPSALPAAPADATHGWQDLGEHPVGTMVEVVVPAGTASLVLVEQLTGGGPPDQLTGFLNPDGSTSIVPNLAVIGELWNPAGQLVYSDLALIDLADPSGELVTVLGAGAVVGSVAYPATSASLQATATAGVAPGTWRVMVNDYAHECWLAAQPTPPPGLAGFSCTPASQRNDASYRLAALTTPSASGGAAAIQARGTIDVAFHLVDDPAPIIGITAAQAVTHPDTRRMVESFGWFLSGAGVCLGTVTFYDEPAWARERFASHTSADDATPCGNLPQLLATSTPGAPTMDLFLLPFLVQRPGATGTVIGVDGTIPGPATINGTIASGAAVSAEDLSFGTCPPAGSGVAPRITSASYCGADQVAIVAAHEAGHFLGLYHPTEAGGTYFDPLADTPHCEYQAACGVTPSACANGVPGALCLRGSRVRGGGANLMFWQLHGATAGFLSPEQARVVRSSPLVRSP